MKIGIIITCKNLLDYTAQAIESCFTMSPHIIIVIDDFSTDGTKKYLMDLLNSDPRIHTIVDPITYSLAEKWNMGIEYAIEQGCEAFLVCNNDIIFNPVTIDALIARMRKGDVGMVTAHNVRGHLTDPQDILTLKVDWEATEAESPDFSCFLLSKAAFKKVGPFDQNFIPCYFEDSDYHLRMGKAGIKAVTTTGAPYFHYGSQTQNATPGGLCKPVQFDRLREYLRNKHGTVPGEPEYDKICRRES